MLPRTAPLLAALALVALAPVAGGQAATPSGSGAGADPLAALNAVRALAQVPPVKAEPAWAAQCAAHASYLARADRAEHRQDPASPYRTAAGEACAPGHYFVSSQPGTGAARALTYWATGSFHLPQLIDPRLRRAALGLAQDAGGGVRSAAVLDVRRGLEVRPALSARYPVRFPAPGTRSPYREAARFEWPDPLGGCPGYAHPVGAPVALLLGPGRAVTAAALKVNGRPVAACLLTATRFTAPSPGDTRVGRAILAAQGGAALLPRLPLPAGAQVQVSFKTAQGRVGWSFQVAR